MIHRDLRPGDILLDLDGAEPRTILIISDTKYLHLASGFIGDFDWLLSREVDPNLILIREKAAKS